VRSGGRSILVRTRHLQLGEEFRTVLSTAQTDIQWTRVIKAAVLILIVKIMIIMIIILKVIVMVRPECKFWVLISGILPTY